MATVTENLDLPGGGTPTGPVVELELVGTNGEPVLGYIAGSSIIGELRLTIGNGGIGADGSYTVTLAPNGEIVPSGTRWRRTVTTGSGATDVVYWNLDADGDHQALDVLTEPPGAIASAAVEALVAAETAAREAALELLVPASEKGTAGGIATLDEAGTVPDEQIPATITRDAELEGAIAVAVADAVDGLSGTYAPLVGPSGGPSIVQAMREGKQSVAMLLQGDSTGDATTEAPYQLADWLAAQYPAYSFMCRLWNHTNQCYSRYTLPRIGTAGVPYVTLDGTGDMISTPDSVALSITGDLSLVAAIRLADYTPAANNYIVGKDSGGGNRSYRLYLHPDGALRFGYSTDGTNWTDRAATQGLQSAASLTDNVSDVVVAVTFDVDNGAGGNDVKFWWAPFTSGQIGSWTQIGATVTNAGAVTIHDNGGSLRFGANSAGVEGSTGRLYYGEVRSGLDLTNSPIVASPHPAQWVRDSTFNDGEGNVWTLNGDAAVTGAPSLVFYNASAAGQDIAYSTDSTRFAKQTPLAGPVLAIINYGLNGQTSITTSYSSLIDSLRTKYPTVAIACLTQGPKFTPTFSATHVRAQHLRMQEVRQVAAVKQAMVIDTMRAVMATATPQSLTDDDIHPNAAGVAVWLAEMKRPFTPYL